MLKGAYYFRQIFYLVGYQSGGLQEASALYGSLTFNGAGAYSGAVTFVDSGSQTQNTRISGLYSISASGYGFISNPFLTGDYIYGLVNSSGIFAGSTTETQSGFNDLFVAAPAGSTAPTAASLKGSYSIAGIDLSTGNPAYTWNYLLNISPNGSGSLGTASGTAYQGQNGSTASPQNITGGTYSASNGILQVNFPSSTTAAISGQKYFYISADGNFIFGGSPQGFDMIVGVRTGAGSPAFGGLYYQARRQTRMNRSSCHRDLQTWIVTSARSAPPTSP